MGERDTVTEIRARAALRVDVPLAMGSNVGSGVEDLLSMADAVLHVADVEVRNVEKNLDGLEVDVTIMLTLHLSYPLEDDAPVTVETRLRKHDHVVSVTSVDVAESYAIEDY